MTSHVYIISRILNGQLSQPVKIGVSDTPVLRLRELQTGSPHPLVIVRAFRCPSRPVANEIEKDMHRRLKEDCENGEWFNIDPIQAVVCLALLTEAIAGEWSSLDWLTKSIKDPRLDDD